MFEYDKTRRIVITGLGIISSLGFDQEEFWSACLNGKCGLTPFSMPGTPFSKLQYSGAVTEFGGNIDEFGVQDEAKRKAIRKGFKLMSREILMSVAASERALADAAVDSQSVEQGRAGVSFASDYIITTPEEVLAGMTACKEGDKLNFSRWAQDGLTKMTPIWQLKFLTNMPSSHISIYNQFFGFANAINGREASIGQAVGEAVEVIRRGKIDLLVVGATGSRVHPFKLIHSIQNDEIADQTLDPAKACRPFDPSRTGTVPGEGAGALILEELEHAKKRGAKIYGEVVAGTCRAAVKLINTSNGCKTVQADNQLAIERALTVLLKTTGFDPTALGHLNVSGFGMRQSDRDEAQAIRNVFGNLADSIPVTTLKGHFGNPGAGAGALELIASVLALKHNALFPILNNTKDDPECPICPVRNTDIKPGDSFIKLAFQTMGQASAILVKRFAE